MTHWERLFPQPEGIKLAAPRVLKWRYAIVPILCVTSEVGSPTFSATSKKINQTGSLLANLKMSMTTGMRYIN